MVTVLLYYDMKQNDNNFMFDNKRLTIGRHTRTFVRLKRGRERGRGREREGEGERESDGGREERERRVDSCHTK